MTRRELLFRSGGSLGGIALAVILGESGLLAAGPHHAPKAKRIVQLFMNGGVSQCDTFDYKPTLQKKHGQKFDPGTGEKVEGVTSVPGNLMKSPFPFKQHGRCGRWVSSIFPHLAGCVDDLAFLLALASKSNVHGPASYMMNTGFILPGFPCFGAWLSYGLGELKNNLPTFVVLPDARGLPYNQKGNFSAGFLPQNHQGLILNYSAQHPPADAARLAIPDLAPSPKTNFVTPESDNEGRDLLAKWNQRHAQENPGDTRLEARIASYELAAKMQRYAPEALDLAKETAATHHLYGTDNPQTADFGRRCLLARRLLERGVRFVQVWSGAGGPTNNWDNHSDIIKELPAIASTVDQPAAALLKDMKARGLLDDSLIVFSTEFGRQPFTQGATGRDHNAGTAIAWLAGAGIKSGIAYGESDEWSWRAAKDATYCYDLHATLLHLLGFDHTKLTFRHNGSDRRLTDVHGHVINAILA
jgi:hypothetical protein